MAKSSFSSANDSMNKAFDRAIEQTTSLAEKALDVARITSDYEAKLAKVNEKLATTETKLVTAAAEADDFKNKFEQADATVANLNRRLNDALERVAKLSNKGDFTATFQRSVEEFQAYLKSVNFSDTSGFYDDNISQWLEEIRDGAITAGEAIEKFKVEYKEYILTANSGDAGTVDFLNGLSVTLDGLTGQLATLMDVVNSIKEDGVKAVQVVGGETDTMASSANTAGQAMTGLSEASQEAYKNMTELVSAIKETSSGDISGLSNLSSVLLGLGSISANTFGVKTKENLISFVKQLQALSEAGKNLAPIKFDMTGFKELNSVDKKALGSLTSLANALSANGEALSKISDLGHGAENVSKLFATDPSSGINNLKVSKASLENLSINLPKIAEVDAAKIEKIFNIDTSGINSLKVSKPSITNVENLARAAEILKNNGIDLTLKGDATEELKNLTQETVNVTDAQAKLRESSKDTGQTVSASVEPLGRSATLLDGLSLSVESFDEKKLADINRALKWEGVTNEADREQILSVFKDFDGTITSVQAKWKDFPHIGERVSQVLVKGVDAVGREFQKVINWKELLDKETKTYVPFVEQEETVRYTANMEKLVNMTRAEADVEERLRSIRLDLKSADVNGITGDNVNYKGVQEYANALHDLLQNTDANSTTQKQFNADLADLEAKYRANTLALRDDVTAAKEDAKARSELVNIVEAQAKISKEIRSAEKLIGDAKAAGLSENSEDVLALREYVDTLHTLSSDLDPTKTKQRDFIATFNELSASVVDSTLNIERAIDRSKDFAAAEKAAAKAAAELANTVQARGAIGKAATGIDKTVSGAQAVGVSVDNADLQQLAVYRQLLAELDAELDDLNLTQKEFSTIMGNLKAMFQAPEAAVKKLTAELKQHESHIAKSAKTYGEIEKAAEGFADANNSSSEAVRNAYEKINMLGFGLDDAARALRNGEITEERYDQAVKDANDSLEKQTAILRNAGYSIDGSTSKFAELTQQLTRFLTPLYLARKAWQTLREMANVVIELEDAFAQLQIVTGATDQELEKFYETSANIAQSLGKSITDIAASIEVFSRLGYSLPDATQLAQYATILSNVAGVSTDEATTGLTSIIKGYNMHVEQAEHVSDVLISIGQKYAVSAGEMMEAYERSGAALAATNTSFEKSAAIIAAANAAIQNSSTVGKFMPMHTVMYA